MFENECEELGRQGLLRMLRRIDSSQGPSVILEGREVVLLCSNNYLGLAEHPRLRQAAQDAIERYGFGSGASRLISGTMSLHEELEARIARFKGTEAAIHFNSGYAANTGVIPSLAGERDALFSDSLNHASIIDGCRLSKARTFVYRHNDMSHLEDLLRVWNGQGRRAIVTDGVFSMDGDLAPLPELVSLAEKYDALVMVDDAHGTGVYGLRGRGTVEHFGLQERIPVQMGTLGKALGSFGAYVAGDHGLIRYLLNSARSYMFSTSLPPAVCAASMAAIELVDTEPWRRERLWQVRERFVTGLARRGVAVPGSPSPIIPVPVGDADKAVAAADRLFQEGIFAPAIRPPTVPPGTSRIRATVMASHNDSQIDQAIDVFGKLADEGFFRKARHG